MFINIFISEILWTTKTIFVTHLIMVIQLNNTFKLLNVNVTCTWIWTALLFKCEGLFIRNLVKPFSKILQICRNCKHKQVYDMTCITKIIRQVFYELTYMLLTLVQIFKSTRITRYRTYAGIPRLTT